MTDSAGLEALASVGADVHASEVDDAFPPTAGVLLDRLRSLYRLDEELETVRRVIEPLAPVPMETSVSLRPGVESESRLTLGFPPHPGDPDARSALVAALSGLGAGCVAAVDEALASLALKPRRRLARSLGIRARRYEWARPRPGAWVGGETAAIRSARIAKALLRLGLDRPAALHRRLAAQLAANPFNAIVPYGLAFDLGPDRVLGAKTYFACEWADVASGFLRGRLADELRLDGVESFELLAASARADRRRGRWLLEVSFDLSADPSRDVRAKAYLPAACLAPNEVEGHAVALQLAAELGLPSLAYEQLLEAIRPDGLTTERPCSLQVGVSASAAGPSLEVYLFDPRRLPPAANDRRR
ncbi:MAG: hypothetical protein ACRDNP_03275 [Gaiellaceae bacterium]